MSQNRQKIKRSLMTLCVYEGAFKAANNFCKISMKFEMYANNLSNINLQYIIIQVEHFYFIILQIIWVVFQGVFLLTADGKKITLSLGM